MVSSHVMLRGAGTAASCTSCLFLGRGQAGGGGRGGQMLGSTEVGSNSNSTFFIYLIILSVNRSEAESPTATDGPIIFPLVSVRGTQRFVRSWKTWKSHGICNWPGKEKRNPKKFWKSHENVLCSYVHLRRVLNNYYDAQHISRRTLSILALQVNAL